MIHIALAAGLVLGASAHAAPFTVSASSGPLEISLSVANRSKSAREPLGYSIKLRNKGNTRFLLVDEVFSDPKHLAENSAFATGVYLEVRDKTGRLRDVETADGLTAFKGPSVYSTAPPSVEKHSDVVPLSPDASIEVPCAESVMIGGRAYCALGFWKLDRPGRYRVRAVYDQLPSSENLISIEDRRVATPWINVKVAP